MKSERNLRGRSLRGAPSAISVHAISRRALLAGLPLLLAGCAGGGMFSGGYGSNQDGGFPVAPVDLTTIDASLMRQEVAWHGKEKPGSIVVNVPQRRLYLIEAGGRALRYAVGVGRAEGMNFRGERGDRPQGEVAALDADLEHDGGDAALPTLCRRPGRRTRQSARRPRALSYRDGRDTFFRLHGTTEPETIGQAVSSGCIRLFNQDIIDLYNRVPLGTHVTVVQR